MSEEKPFGVFEAAGAMGEPVFGLGVSGPVARGTLDGLEGGEGSRVLLQPTLQRAPLSQQGLVRRLDGTLAVVRGDVGGEQPLLDQEIDHWPRFFGNVRDPCLMPLRAAIVRVDASQPRDQGTKQ